jgi:SHS family lactate transporter-like MFS transporter
LAAISTMTNQTAYAVVTTPDAHGNVPPPAEEKMSAREYFGTRVSTLKPPMTKLANPFKLLGMLNAYQWANFGVAFCAWTWDAFDFFTVSMTLEELAEAFGKTKTDITWGISITLMLRAIGSTIFGIAADRYGRKWPFVVNNILFIVLELCTGFCQTFEQFMVVRALFGIAMGGVWGNAAATALEDAPPEARGIISGILQQGYAMGYLLAVVFSRILVDATSHGWRLLFWFGGIPPVFIILWRLQLPETKVYQERERLRGTATNATSTFVAEGKVVFKRNWMLLTYLVFFMAGMNFMSHGSQDLYPTLLKNTLQFNADQVTITMVLAKVGALTGGTIVGYYSQMFGRRLSIMVVVALGACMLYPYCYTSTTLIMLPAFVMQACVQGAWGVIPIHLMELSPPKYSTFVAGTAYQLGNLIASTTATIESALSEQYPLPPGADGKERHDYARVLCALMFMVYAYLFTLTFLGPERRGQEFGAVHDKDLGGAALDAAQYDDMEKNSVTRDHDKQKSVQ